MLSAEATVRVQILSAKLVTLIPGLNTIATVALLPLESKNVFGVIELISGWTLYRSYIDLNGFTINLLLTSSLMTDAKVNPNSIQYCDSKQCYSLKSDYIGHAQGTIEHYI